RERLSDLEHQVGGQQQRGLELKAEADRHESRIHFNEERLREFSMQNSKALAEMTQAEERRRVAEQELNSVCSQLTSSRAALAAYGEAVAVKEEGLRKIEEQTRRKQEVLRQAQAEAFAAAQDCSRLRNEITALDLQKQGNVVRLEKLSAERI